jgi:FkbM family methyltransferase
LTGNLYAGLHEFSEMGFLLHLLRQNDLFVDVGANLGSYTVLASAVCQARTIAFEPVPATYSRLTQNNSMNFLQERVRAEQIAITDHPGEVQITAHRGPMNQVLEQTETQAGTVAVPCARLDDMLKDERPTLLKIDVEGYETSVLRGAPQTLAKSSLIGIIVELNGTVTNKQDIVERLTKQGFQLVSYDPFTRNLSEITLDETAANGLFVRDNPELSTRLKTAPYRRVLSLPI